jgi:thiamine biosynthesis lipoprotein
MLATAPGVATRRFPAMGGEVHSVVVGGDAGTADYVETRVAELEARWSRFRPDSELSRLNAAAGRTVVVSRDTFLAVERAVAAWHATGGRFDPTVLPALVALGYDDDLPAVRARGDRAPGPRRPAPGCAGITLDAIVGAVTLPVGTALDLGGIGKGLAADLVVEELVAAGAAGACVNVGGDLRVQGRSPDGGGWTVAVDGAPGTVLGLAAGGIATSSAARRHWTAGGTGRHHLVDPATGSSAPSPWRAVTVVAGTAAAAEVLTKAAWVAGPDAGAAVVTAAGATGLIVTGAGAPIALAGLEGFLR